jgi:hypothetical protein
VRRADAALEHGFDGTFKTKTEAETGMKTMKVCTSN